VPQLVADGQAKAHMYVRPAKCHPPQGGPLKLYLIPDMFGFDNGVFVNSFRNIHEASAGMGAYVVQARNNEECLELLMALEFPHSLSKYVNPSRIEKAVSACASYELLKQAATIRGLMVVFE